MDSQNGIRFADAKVLSGLDVAILGTFVTTPYVKKNGIMNPSIRVTKNPGGPCYGETFGKCYGVTQAFNKVRYEQWVTDGSNYSDGSLSAVFESWFTVLVDLKNSI